MQVTPDGKITDRRSVLAAAGTAALVLIFVVTVAILRGAVTGSRGTAAPRASSIGEGQLSPPASSAPRQAPAYPTQQSSHASDERDDQPGEDLLGAIANCVDRSGGDQHVLRTCVQALDLSAVGPEDLGHWVCASESGEVIHRIVVSHALHSRSPEAALGYLSEFQGNCDRYQESRFSIQCLLDIEQQDPAWIRELEWSLTPETLFSGSDPEAVVQVAELFLERGNPLVRGLLEDGGRGIFGGSGDQVARAALITCVHAEGPAARLEYVESILHSASAPASRKLAQLLASELARPRTWAVNSSSRALQDLLLLLDDARFGRDAAAQITVQFPRAGWPGCDSALWQQAYSRAEALVQQGSQ